MPQVIQKIKNWLIKKLGGHTKAEYDDTSRFPITKFEFLPPAERHDVITLGAEAIFDYFRSDEADYIENRLIRSLSEQMKPYVNFVREDDRMNLKSTIYAYVKVVDCNG